MPYKDKERRYAAIRKSVAKKPELYKELGKINKRRANRRGYQMQRRYGITIEQYEEKLQSQGHSCAICRKPETKTVTGLSSLYIDHNHSTGQARGLLCARCNSLIGFLEQDDFNSRLEKARGYLENYSKA